MPDDKDTKDRPATRRNRSRRASRRAGVDTGSAKKVLDVYGTVTGNGEAVDSEDLRVSIREALG
jgi:hypothetical protein